mgnify:CR=1 FL=1
MGCFFIYYNMILKKDRRNEWPISKWWYTQYAGKTFEQAVLMDYTFIKWAIETFQNVTPKQAEFYEKITGDVVPEQAIQNVEPYEWQKGDPEELYMELCENQNLELTLNKYRKKSQLTLF